MRLSDNNPYIPKEKLKSLDSYKYVGNDRSLVAKYIMQPFWTFVVNFLPQHMAPNTVTLVGFSTVILSYLLFVYYSPTLTETAPSWVYFLCAFCTFFYQTMDAIDGKQARKTDTSSALGELFDHGCDAITTVIVTLQVACTLHIINKWIVFLNVILVLSSLFLTIWNLYFTNEFDLGVVNVTEALLATTAMHIISGFDPTFWDQKISLPLLGTIPYSYIPIFVSLGASLFTSITSVMNVIKKYDNRSENLKSALSYSIPFWVLSIGGSLWALLSPADLLHTRPHLFLLNLGWINAYCVGRLMVQRLCLMKPKTFYYVLIPIPVAVINCFTGLVSDNTVLSVSFAVTFFFWLHFILVIIEVFCESLGINCLTLTEKQKENLKKKNEKKSS
eukprot:TRINITY_DN5042_c0_g1_i1.p1 TRINITY_DN5042_c0_g1~~TRINITY_DN5042_c0_g1_i1.p1  ORF type:complete len:389 (+),score=25.47 TRINITY_DN5042_c0_g1_i1:41-1207(+)